MTKTLEELTSDIAAKFVQSRILDITPILGLGSVNTVMLVKTTDKKYIVRLNIEEEITRFRKENWCIQQALAFGIPSPSVLDVGVFSGTAYMLQTFIEGENGKHLLGDKTAIWTKLGQYARQYHLAPIFGFGEDLIDERQGQFRDTWQRFVRYNIDSLTTTDPLLALDVLTPTTSAQVRLRFEQLLQTPFTFGLNHGDVADWNTITNQKGEVFLLDWGCANAHIIPHFELNQIIRSGFSPKSNEFLAFLQGYGLAEKDFKAIQPELRDLAMLQAIDKLRWSIDRRPAKIEEFAKHAKLMVSLV